MTIFFRSASSECSSPFIWSFLGVSAKSILPCKWNLPPRRWFSGFLSLVQGWYPLTIMCRWSLMNTRVVKHMSDAPNRPFMTVVGLSLFSFSFFLSLRWIYCLRSSRSKYNASKIITSFFWLFFCVFCVLFFVFPSALWPPKKTEKKKRKKWGGESLSTSPITPSQFFKPSNAGYAGMKESKGGKGIRHVYTVGT